MRHIINLLMSLIPILFLGCQHFEPSQHDIFRGDLQLPRNLVSGGFYDFIDPPYYAIYKTDHFEYVEITDKGNLKQLSIDEIPAKKNVIVYVDASANWSVLKSLFRDLDGRSFNRIHVAYDSNSDAGTAGGQTLPIQSVPNRRFKNIYDLVMTSEGAIYDLVSDTKYQSRELLNIGYATEAILVRGTSTTTVGEIIELIDFLSLYPGRENRCFLNIK